MAQQGDVVTLGEILAAPDVRVVVSDFTQLRQEGVDTTSMALEVLGLVHHDEEERLERLLSNEPRLVLCLKGSLQPRATHRRAYVWVAEFGGAPAFAVIQDHSRNNGLDPSDVLMIDPAVTAQLALAAQELLIVDALDQFGTRAPHELAAVTVRLPSHDGLSLRLGATTTPDVSKGPSR